MLVREKPWGVGHETFPSPASRELRRKQAMGDAEGGTAARYATPDERW